MAEALSAERIRADVIHANNVLAHVADLTGVVDGIRILLTDNGVAVIEAPYVRDLIDHCEFDTIYHEHLCYFSVTAISRLMARQAFLAEAPFVNKLAIIIHSAESRAGQKFTRSSSFAAANPKAA